MQHVVLFEDDVVHWILDFMRRRGFLQSMRTLERESNVCALAGITQEGLYLRSLVLDGKWTALHRALDVLLPSDGIHPQTASTEAQGASVKTPGIDGRRTPHTTDATMQSEIECAARIRFLVKRQEYIELLAFDPSTDEDLPEAIKAKVLAFQLQQQQRQQKHHNHHEQQLLGLQQQHASTNFTRTQAEKPSSPNTGLGQANTGIDPPVPSPTYWNHPMHVLPTQTTITEGHVVVSKALLTAVLALLGELKLLCQDQSEFASLCQLLTHERLVEAPAYRTWNKTSSRLELYEHIHQMLSPLLCMHGTEPLFPPNYLDTLLALGLIRLKRELNGVSDAFVEVRRRESETQAPLSHSTDKHTQAKEANEKGHNEEIINNDVPINVRAHQQRIHTASTMENNTVPTQKQRDIPQQSGEHVSSSNRADTQIDEQNMGAPSENNEVQHDVAVVSLLPFGRSQAGQIHEGDRHHTNSHPDNFHLNDQHLALQEQTQQQRKGTKQMQEFKLQEPRYNSYDQVKDNTQRYRHHHHQLNGIDEISPAMMPSDPRNLNGLIYDRIAAAEHQPFPDNQQKVDVSVSDQHDKHLRDVQREGRNTVPVAAIEHDLYFDEEDIVPRKQHREASAHAINRASRNRDTTHPRTHSQNYPHDEELKDHGFVHPQQANNDHYHVDSPEQLRESSPQRRRNEVKKREQKIIDTAQWAEGSHKFNTTTGPAQEGIDDFGWDHVHGNRKPKNVKEHRALSPGKASQKVVYNEHVQSDTTAKETPHRTQLKSNQSGLTHTKLQQQQPQQYQHPIEAVQQDRNRGHLYPSTHHSFPPQQHDISSQPSSPKKRHHENYTVAEGILLRGNLYFFEQLLFCEISNQQLFCCISFAYF